jgi:alkaline phosphatase D
MRIFYFLLFSMIAFSQCSNPTKQSLATTITSDISKDTNEVVIAFGSCNKSNEPQDYWQTILNNQPNYWLWLGDIIYADTEDMSKLKAMYSAQKVNPFYQQLLEKSRVYGIWDDHDYGENDGGKTYVKKVESQQLLFDFLDYPESDFTKSEGAFHAININENSVNVKVIFLDTRYFRDELEKNPTWQPRYLINETGDILGEAQWKWLERELSESEADLNVICSSIQIIPEEQFFEKWANFPTARKRFFELLNNTKAENIMLLSGDRHIAEVSKIQLNNRKNPIFEITSSGLTHAYENPKAKLEKNQYRVGELVNERNFGVLKINKKTAACMVEIKNMNNKTLLSQQILK